MSRSDPLCIPAPGSKSQTQRALILAALAHGSSRLLDPLECDDTFHLRAALRQLGVKIRCQPGAWDMERSDGELQLPAAPLQCGEGGTTLRFLAPLSLLLDGPLVLEGRGRLRRRPVVEMVQALQQLGVEVQLPSATPPRAGLSLPLQLQLRGAPGHACAVETSRSSQFLSGLLLVGPSLPRGLRLEAGPSVVSRPYVELTLRAMEAFGLEVSTSGEVFEVPPAQRQGCEAFQVEGDWSAAAFLLVAARICGRELELPNLDPRSVQGDRVMAEFLARLDRPGPHSFDLTDCPDLIAPLAVACALSDTPCRVVGAAHTRLKESDRVSVLARGLRSAGVEAWEQQDGIRLEPPARLHPARLDPCGDHRMAMAFGLLRLRQPGIEVQEPGCVSKSYPRFWDDLKLFGAKSAI